MSALALALASSLNIQQMQPASPASSSSALSSSPSCSSLSSRSTRSTCSDTSIASTSSAPLRVDPVPRPNEHLAVLLPKQLWKADAHAAHCDNFYCRVPFSIFERRHHCRKCGGVFCAPCTSRSTALLDASNLAFLHPPRNTPLTVFEGPASPILTARVCDDCYDQIHGCRTPELPPRLAPVRAASLLSLSSPIALFKPRSASTSAASSPPSDDSVCSSPCVLPSPTVSALTRTRPASRRQRSYGELDAYPLKRASLLCKATGGGRWEPKPETPDPGVRVPIIGGKAPYELEMEREEAEERRRRSNPVIRDGDFQYRFPAAEPEPVVLE
ncbi:FYVE zinc finger-domain-containing protein, partial [Mycena rosella]